MDNFRLFFEKAELEKDIEKTLVKLPKKHAKLINNFLFKWINGSTLPNDDKHIGEIDFNNKKIVIASPYFYPREFTLLHELAHRVWSLYINSKLKKEWHNVVKKNPNRSMKENDEENFCHAYANFYSKNKIKKHDNKEWMEFIKNKVPS